MGSRRGAPIRGVGSRERELLAANATNQIRCRVAECLVQDEGVAGSNPATPTNT